MKGANEGKKREQAAEKELSRIFEESGIIFHKLPDTYTARGRAHIPPQPSDFIVFFDGEKGAFVEYKFGSDEYRWTNNSFRDLQWETLLKCRATGAKYWVLVECKQNNCWYMTPGNFFADFQEENNTKSINWSHFEPYKIESLSLIPERLRS